MGRRNFHGQVVTLGDACEADYLVTVRCERCDTRRPMHPYNIICRHEVLKLAALDTMLPGFFCKTCRSRVSVVVSCTYKRSGEL
jgi:hypothetical protein